jgi:glycosyltransferase involved in cell wall biosynthesis
LAARGHDVTLLCSGFPGCLPSEELDGIEVRRVGGRMTFSLRAPAYFKSYLGKDRFDVVVEDLNKVPVFMPFWTRTPVVLLVHHLFGSTAFREASFPVASATWILERPVPRVFHGSAVAAVSESTAEDLRARGMTGSSIALVPNAVDLEELSPAPETDRFDQPTLLYLGRLKRYKGIDLILKAVARVRKGGIPVRTLIAGKGDYAGKLKNLASKLGIGDTVDFLGYVPEEEKVRLFQRSWVHVLTSPKEGWGISILEAAACGTATVASRSPGLKDAVLHGKTGLLTPHGDVEKLSQAISGLLTDPSARVRMGKAARRFAEGFTWEDSALRMEAILEDRVAAAHPQA